MDAAILGARLQAYQEARKVEIALIIYLKQRSFSFAPASFTEEDVAIVATKYR